MNISIIIAFYNEAARVPHLKSKLREMLQILKRNHQVELVLVDDGSTDQTHQLLSIYFAESAHQILRHEKNRGIGAAMRTGFQAARGDYLCTMDSHCTYDPIQLVWMIGSLNASGADIITGSPYHPKGAVENVKRWRLLLSRGLSRSYSLILPYTLHTYTSFFRVYRRRVIETIEFQSDDFLAVTELLVRAMLQGYQVVEFPTTLRARRYNHSKIRILRVMKGHLGFISQIVMGRISRRAPARVAPADEITQSVFIHSALHPSSTDYRSVSNE